ncbi:MAG: transglutaminase-like domain-containing protein [Balneolaceae bacterium]
MAEKSEIESLLYLLDDPDPEVQTGVHNRFRELGENAVPLLDQFRAEADDAGERDLIHDIIHSITFGSLYEEFSELLGSGIENRRQLERAVLLLGRFGNPTLREKEYTDQLDLFARRIYGEIVSLPEESQKMHTLLRYLFRELRFTGDEKNYHHPDNAYIDRVMDRRKGLPISLSLIVMFLGRRLDLPFYGVNMPIHFMLLYEGEREELLIDPFDGGTVVSYDQCCFFLKKNGIEPRPEHLQRADEQLILSRFIRNLMHSYSNRNREDRVRELKQLLYLVELKG